MPHDEGRKSRCRLVTTMTKRSSHMPTFTIERDDEQRRHARAHALEPEHLRHDDVAEDQRPVRRRVRARSSGSSIMKPSYLSALYQAMNASIV